MIDQPQTQLAEVTQPPTDPSGAVALLCKVRSHRKGSPDPEHEAQLDAEIDRFLSTASLTPDTSTKAPVDVEAGEFVGIAYWEHEDQRDLSRMYHHRFDDSLQFNRGQMRHAIRYGKTLAERRTPTNSYSLAALRERQDDDLHTIANRAAIVLRERGVHTAAAPSVQQPAIPSDSAWQPGDALNEAHDGECG